jgi:hypothetical protein
VQVPVGVDVPTAETPASARGTILTAIKSELKKSVETRTKRNVQKLESIQISFAGDKAVMNIDLRGFYALMLWYVNQIFTSRQSVPSDNSFPVPCLT